MTFLLWQRDGDVAIASPRVVLRAAEVPLLGDAQRLCATLQRLRSGHEQQLAEATRQGRGQGHAQGLEEGLRQAREQGAAALLSLAQAAASERGRLRHQVADLALEVVRKLLGQFADDAVLAALAATAAAEILPTQPVALVVHLDRCQAVRERLQDAAATQAHNSSTLRCEVRGDPSCASDACRIETGFGSVDASLDAQLARLEAAWRATETAEAS